MAARRFAWVAGFVLIASCKALVLKALPEFGVAASVGLTQLAWIGVPFAAPCVRRCF